MDNNCENMRVLIYTRKPKNEYTELLSNSIHFTFRDEKNYFRPLNENYGILFASAMRKQ